MAKVELSNETLDEVMGGITFVSATKKLGVTGGEMLYSYDSEDACREYVIANYKKYSYLERDQKLIEGMLAAGLIHE